MNAKEDHVKGVLEGESIGNPLVKVREGILEKAVSKKNLYKSERQKR